MDYAADHSGLNGGDVALDFQTRHFVRRDTHVYDTSQLSHLPPYNAAALASLAVDVKPRLTKEQHDVLENEFQKQSKPNTNTKKRFAEVLGVSLDKVNNWFQNRRAKSKQDAKKQAGAFNLLQVTQNQPNFPMMNAMSSGNISPTYCPPDAFDGMRDSAILDGPMSNGLGISQAEAQSHVMPPNFSMPMNLGSIGMQKQRSQHMHPIGHEIDEENRRTLTQAQFDAFGPTPSFDPASSSQDQFDSGLQEQQYPQTTQEQCATGSEKQSIDNVSATITNPADIYADYNFPDLCNFGFDSANNADPITSTPMQFSNSSDSYDNVPSSSSSNQARTASGRSDSSTPSVSITPAHQEMDPFDFALPNQTSQMNPSQSVSGASWQPGQSIPVDLAALQQEFQEAAMRNRTQSVPSIPQHQFLEQPLAYPIDEAFRRESSATQLANSMQNFSMQGQRSSIPTSSIATRRQRPRPAPLGGASLRSTSYSAQLPTSPTSNSMSNKHTANGQTLRRIKSSQTMNGISNGRIQKNLGSAQRSPSGVSFGDVNRFARRVSSFSPGFAGIPPLPTSSAGLAPPTPMSPTSYANFQARQQSIGGDSDGDMMTRGGSSNNFSPPTTPVYAAHFARGRLGSTAMAENTPPQSAPASQQSFSNTSFAPGAGQMQSPMSTVPVLQSQPHGFVPIMSNEYPQMPNVMFPGQQQAVPNQFMEMPMSYIMTSNGEVHMGYPVVAPFAQQMQHQGTPPHAPRPFVPSSDSSPGTMVSSQVPKHSTPTADFFVHEYTPPQDVKQLSTPRKAADGGPKNYTFSNHGPEYFEKNVKKANEGSSPCSSGDGSNPA